MDTHTPHTHISFKERLRWVLFYWLWHTGGTSSKIGDLGLLLIRLVFGLSMAFAHGSHKCPPSEGFIKLVDDMGFPFASFFGWMAGLSEWIGGICVALGVSTRLMTFFLINTLGVAVFIKHAQDAFKKQELGLLYLTLFLFLFLVGSGRYSLESLWQKERKKEEVISKK